MTSNEIRAFWRMEVRVAKGDEPPTIKGTLPYNSPSEDLGGFREVLKPGCFKSSLKSRDVIALWSHDSSRPLASTRNGSLRLKDGPEGLEIEFDIDQRISWARDAYLSIKNGNLSGLSFGFLCEKEAWPSASLREVISANLLEISPVVFPAYPSAGIAARSAVDESVKAYWEAQDMRAFFGRRA